jgi:hypothetical protein
MKRCRWRLGSATLCLLVALCALPRSALAQDGACAANHCECYGHSDNIPCGSSCEDWCSQFAGGSSSSGDGAGSGSGGASGPGLIDALMTLFTPKPPTDEELAAAAANKAAQEEKEARERAEKEAKLRILQARIAKGRDLLAVWEAYKKAFEAAHNRPVPREIALRFLAMLAKRDRMPVAALAQGHCAAFHSELADRMEAWRHDTSPHGSPLWLDYESQADSIGAPFDTGTAVKGCESYAPAGLGVPLDEVDLRPVATETRAALQALKPAALQAVQAEGAYREAEQRYHEIEQNVAKKVEAVKVLTGTFDELKKEVEKAKKEVAKAELDLKKLAWAKQKLEMHERFDQMLAEQGKAHEHLDSTEKLIHQTEEQLARENKDAAERKQDFEAKRKLYQAALKIWEEKKHEVAELQRKVRENNARFARAGAAPLGFFPPTPRAVSPW